VRIAVIGAGISGLGSAHLLEHQGHAVTLFEANDYLGGHTCTVDVTLEGQTAPVDTGFLVFNDRTYPLLIALFEQLGVASTASEMSFSVRADEHGIEWSGTDLAALFAQPANALRPAFWRMLADILRFNRETTRLLERADTGTAPAGATTCTVGQYLASERYSTPFRDWYLFPMAAAIWSAPRLSVQDFPLLSFIRFCRNHGLLQILDRPQWRTVTGGGRTYVAKIAAQLRDVRISTPVLSVRRPAAGPVAGPIAGPIAVTTAQGAADYDAVVFACHSDQALRLLADPDADESRLLGAVRYQPNDVWLHTDDHLLPRARRAWSAWNYLSASDPDGQRPVAVSYLINKLQPLPFATPVVVSLNPPFEPRPQHVLRKMVSWHPLLDSAAVAAQAGVAGLQGRRNTWFAGAWLGYGFHEDGLRSAHAVADLIGRSAHA
jgi:predicted NAD/FAD-binding protein